jgi:hypothetical protein
VQLFAPFRIGYYPMSCQHRRHTIRREFLSGSP